MSKMNKILVSILAAIVVAISTVVPSAFADNGDSKLIPITITDYYIEYNGQTIKGEENDPDQIEYVEGKDIRLLFDWKIEDVEEGNPDLQAGDFSLIQLPSAFKKHATQYTGTLKGMIEGELVDIGTWSITDDNELKWTYNDVLQENNKERSGKFEFLLAFNEVAIEDDAKQEIHFGDADKVIDIIIKPSGDNVHEIQKNGSPNSAVNADTINWQILVNTTLDKLVDGKITDVIPEGLELNLDSIEVKELKVGMNGSYEVIDDNPTHVSTTSSTKEKLVVDLGNTTSAYLIDFSTAVKEYKEEGYFNVAEVYSNTDKKADASASVDFLQGSMVEKSVEDLKKDAKDITWTIDVNKSESNLGTVLLEDIIPAGLKLTELKLYDLTYNNSTNQWETSNEESLTVTDDNKITLTLENLSSAKRLVYKTKVLDVEEYQKVTTFTNEVTLSKDETELGNDTATATLTRRTLIEKKGSEITDYDQDGRFSWTLDINKAKHKITDLVVTDTIGAGHELDVSTLKLYNDKNELLSFGTDYELVESSVGGFKIKFYGEINSTYKIEYETIITDYSQAQYDNGFGITGGGIGPENHDGNKPVKPTIKNDFSKIAHRELTVDYATKTMGWQLVIDAKKEGIQTGLVVTDTFVPSGSMAFLEDTLKVYEGTTILVKDVDYKLDGSISNATGFKLTFIRALDKAVYRIEYHTTFDPDHEVDGVKLVPTEIYKNIVNFKGKTDSGITIDTNDDEKYTIKDEFANNGNKYAESVSIVDGVRRLTWSLNINTLEQDFTGKDFVIVDELDTSGGSEYQVHDQDVKVYENTISGDNYDTTTNITWDFGSPLEEGVDYQITYNNDQKYTLTFENGIDKSYHITYTTSLKGVSQKTYSNLATVTGKGGFEKEYPASTTYHKYNDYITKESVGIDKAYTDDIIDWKLTLNTTHSEIKDANFKDRISEGHVLLNGSLTIQVGSETLVGYEKDSEPVIANPDFIYWLEDIEDSESKMLIVTFTETLTKEVVVTYQTVVIATGGTINNVAGLYGNDGQLGESSAIELEASISSGGSAVGQRARGNIRINKRHTTEDGPLVIQETKFELVYDLNGEERIVNGEAQSTVNGVLIYENLPYRKYTLREKTPPKGFVASTIEIEIDLKASTLDENKYFTVDFINEKIKDDVSASKTWVDGDTLERPVVYFKLFRSIKEDAKLGDKGVELVDVELKKIETGTETNPITVTWTDLDVTDDAGNPYTYLVQEVDANGDSFTPTNYNKVENGLKVTNTYESPKDDVSATKSWENGSLLKHPTVYFKLYRTTVSDVTLEHDSVEEVDDAVAALQKVETPKGTSSVTVTWEKLDVTNTKGEPFYYLVKEVDADGNALTPDNYEPAHNGLTVTNKYVSPKTSVTVKKSWVDGKELFDNIEVQLFRDGIEHLKPVELNGDHDKVWSHTWSGLDETDEQGKQYKYTVKEVKGVDNFTPSYSEDTLEITNTYSSPKSDVEAKKVWVNGDTLDRPVVYFKLYRSIIEDAVLGDVGVEAVEVDRQKIETPEGENDVTVKWENLEDTDTDGNTYYYLVEEVDSEGNVLALENYVVLEEGLKVTNTYVSPTTTKTVNKSWVDGKTRVKEIEVQLYQDEEPYGDPVKLNGEHDETWSYSWEKLNVTDIDGVDHVYTVKEITNLENFDPGYSEDTFDITNTYVVPTRDVEATKVWTNGDALERPVIYFKLYRSIYEDAVLGDEGVEAVEVSLQTIDTPEGENEVKVKWENLEDTDTDGNTYYYLVEEVDEEGNAMIPEDYDVSYDGLEITNTYVSPLTSKTVKKIWVEGPVEKDQIEVQLYRNGEPHLDPVTLDGTEEDPWIYTWDKLDLNDHNGVEYVYSVQEVTEVENFGVEYSEVDGVFVITNTFESPTTSVIGRKSWINGPIVKPDVTLQLLRNGEAHLEPVVLKSGEYEYIWLDLDVLDNTGELYVYTVEEVDVPENYIASYDGIDVTNTYVIPVTDITVEKLWIHEKRETQTIGVQLYRNGEAFGDVVRLEKGTNTYTWNDLDLTDLSGNEYVYTVDEVEVPLGYHKEVHGFTIINTFDQGLLDALLPKPEEKPKDKLPLTGAVSLASIATGTLLASGLFFALSKKRKED